MLVKLGKGTLEVFNDFFPYDDAFKGSIFGKSCDFILADKSIIDSKVVTHNKVLEGIN